VTTSIPPANERLLLAARVLFLLLFIVAARTGYLVNLERLDTMLFHRSDPWGYYQFLPALIGTHEWTYLPWSHPMEDGTTLGLFTMGVAWLHLPFFLIAMAWAALAGEAVDGYSRPFTIMQFVSTAFYLAAGCHLLFHALRRLVPGPVALLTPMVLFGATNLFFYSTYEPGSSHVYSFFLVAALLLLTLRMLERPTAPTLMLLVACSGLIVLIRQPNVVVLLIPLFLGTTSLREALHTRWAWLRTHARAAGDGLLLAGFMSLPQVLYWHHITGQLFVFTYGRKDEGFNWSDPHFLDVLVSHQNGWFVYTPIMVVVMVVLVVGAMRGHPHMRPVLAAWVLTWTVYASWWCWWLGGSFGHRGFVEHYALLSIPLATGMRWIRAKGMLWRIVAYAVMFLFVFINIRLSVLYQWPWEGPDWTWERLLDVWKRIPELEWT